LLFFRFRRAGRLLPPNGFGNVGLFPPNAWGLYDMCGNLAEWTTAVDEPETPENAPVDE